MGRTFTTQGVRVLRGGRDTRDTREGHVCQAKQRWPLFTRKKGKRRLTGSQARPARRPPTRRSSGLLQPNPSPSPDSRLSWCRQVTWTDVPSVQAFLHLEATLHFPIWKIASMILKLNIAHAAITSVNEAVRHSQPESESGALRPLARQGLCSALRADGSRQEQVAPATLPSYPSPSLSLPTFFPSFLASIFPSLGLVYLFIHRSPASLSISLCICIILLSAFFLFFLSFLLPSFLSFFLSAVCLSSVLPVLSVNPVAVKSSALPRALPGGTDWSLLTHLVRAGPWDRHIEALNEGFWMVRKH